MANLFGGIYDFLSGGRFDQADSAYQQAINVLMQSVPPQLANLIPALELQLVQGTITPSEAMAVLQEKSAMEGVQANPQVVQAQMDALSGLQQVAQQGGLTATDRARLEDIKDQINTTNRSNQAAVMQRAQEQGIGGSGVDLAARLSGAQAGVTGAARAGVDVAADAEKRALDALVQSGNLAGNIRTQDVGEQTKKAEAADAINALNASLATRANEGNAARTQQAAMQEYLTRNTIEGANVDRTNKERLLPIEVAKEQGDLNNRYGANIAGALQAQGGYNARQGAAQATSTGNAIGGIIKGVMDKGGDSSGSGEDSIWSRVGGWFSDEDLKENVKELTDEDVDAMLHNMTGNKFNYKKGRGLPPGTHAGVMAQDVEKSGLSDQVMDTPDGKMIIHDDMMQSAELAALANFHKRIKTLEGKG